MSSTSTTSASKSMKHQLGLSEHGTKVVKATSSKDDVESQIKRKEKLKPGELSMDDDESFDILVEERRCAVTMWSYGMGNTIMSLLLSSCGLLMSLLAKRTTKFTSLNSSLAPKDGFLPLYALGLYRIELCRHEISEEESLSQAAAVGVMGQFKVLSQIFTESLRDPELCDIYRLDHTTISDDMWDVSRLAGALAILLGFTAISWILLSPCFEGINMRAVACTSVIVYFCESLTFLVFDSNVCHTLGCTFSTGAKYGVVSCVCWFFASIYTAKMYIFHRDLVYKRHYTQESEVKTTTSKQPTRTKPYSPIKNRECSTAADSPASVVNNDV